MRAAPLVLAAGAILLGCQKDPGGIQAAQPPAIQASAPSAATATAAQAARPFACADKDVLQEVAHLVAVHYLLRTDAAASMARQAGLIGPEAGLRALVAERREDIVESIDVGTPATTSDNPLMCRVELVLPQHRQFPMVASYRIDPAGTGASVSATFSPTMALAGAAAQNLEVSYMESLLHTLLAPEIVAKGKADAAERDARR